MEKVIGLLFDIEKKANQILERANDEKTELFEENERLIEKMEAEISAENEVKISLIQAKAEEELETDKKQLLDNSNKQLDELEVKFKKNHDLLVEKVVQSIIHL